MKPHARPFVVPIFIPHSGCRHRCVFCNQTAVTGSQKPLPDLIDVHSEITRFLQFKREQSRFTEISFFGGNFLGLDPDIIVGYLETAAEFVRNGLAQGIRFSTRPDTIDGPRLNLISNFPVSTIEIGVQSMDDEILLKSARGHTAEETRRAVHLIKDHGAALGLQMMVGLPGENREKTRETGEAIAGLCPDFVRIYPTLVIRGSRMASWFEAGRYAPLEMNECIDRVKRLYRLFTSKGISVIRIGLQANDGLDTGADLIAGPYHPAMGEMVLSEIFFETASDQLQSMVRPVDSPIDTIVLHVHPRRVSIMRGQKNVNIERLCKQFPRIRRFKVKPDPELDLHSVVINS